MSRYCPADHQPTADTPSRSLLAELVSLFRGSAVVGLEYVVEVRLSQTDEVLKCTLCSVDCDLPNIMSHLLSSEHRLAYLARHAPTAARRLGGREVTSWRPRSFQILEDVVGRIVGRFGTGQPVVVNGLLSWEREEVNILRRIERADHAR